MELTVLGCMSQVHHVLFKYTSSSYFLFYFQESFLKIVLYILLHSLTFLRLGGVGGIYYVYVGSSLPVPYIHHFHLTPLEESFY